MNIYMYILKPTKRRPILIISLLVNCEIRVSCETINGPTDLSLRWRVVVVCVCVLFFVASTFDFEKVRLKNTDAIDTLSLSN